MPQEDKQKFNLLGGIQGGLMAAAQGLTAVGGSEVPYYTNYLESRNKQLQLQAEATKAQAMKTQQDFENSMAIHKQSIYENQQGVMNQARRATQLNSERNVMNSSGYIPSTRNSLISMDPIARMNALKQRQAGDITGRTYIPKADASQQAIDPAVVSKIANYEVDLKTIPGFGKSSVRNAYLKAAVAANPNFDQKNYAAASKFMTGLADTKRGTAGGTVNSANTLIGHLDYLDSKIEDLKNSKLPAKNLIVNFAKYQLGHPDVTNYKQAEEVVNSEMETLLTGVGTTQQGLAARRTLLSDKSGYKQQKEAVKALIDIMHKRIDPIEKQYKTYGGKDPDRILSKESRAIIDKINGKSSTQKPAKDPLGIF